MRSNTTHGGKKSKEKFKKKSSPQIFHEIMEIKMNRIGIATDPNTIVLQIDYLSYNEQLQYEIKIYL